MLTQSDTALTAANLPRPEVEEGLKQLERRRNRSGLNNPPKPRGPVSPEFLLHAKAGMNQAHARALLKQMLGPDAEFRDDQWEAID